MFIPEEKISEILNASDIIEIISESVTLKKAGNNYIGLCPFHSEKTPSFSVSPQKQIFHCFGCSTGGNALSFLMKQQGVSFPEAVNILAKRYGITLENHNISVEDRQKFELKEQLFRINSRVKDYYVDQLKNSQSADLARFYLQKRGISQKIIDEFGIGYAPDKWDSAVSLLKKMKPNKNIAEQSGLILKQKKGSGYYDRFRNRIIFPIFDVNMQVAGFGGRVMDNSLPKYLNSPETPIYSKGKILYGLHAAKRYCRQTGSAYIVEGYFDFISLYQGGIKNCVATLGTALTSDHVNLLKGCASKIFLVFDSDDAGVKAARRSVDLFIREGVELRIIVLPKGHDPDSFVREYGAKEFEAIAMNAISAIEFLSSMAIKKYGSSIEGKVATLEEIKIYLAAIQDGTTRSLYIREIAQRLGIDEVAVLDKVREVLLNPEPFDATFDEKDLESSQLDEQDNVFSSIGSNSDIEPFMPREEQIISMMLQFPEVIDDIVKHEVVECFYSQRLKEIGQLTIDVATSLYGHSSYIQKTGSYDNEYVAYANITASYDKPAGYYVGGTNIYQKPYDNNSSLVADVMTSAKSDADRELIASLAMMEVADLDDIMAKSNFLIKRIINIRKRNDSRLINEIRRVEQLHKNSKNVQVKQGIKSDINIESKDFLESGQLLTVEEDSGTDPTLELLRQRQIEIRKLRGYE
ncbi:MAG: DNA primase [Desulfamplus sp.]|nr:DNA primase [Desulfamplus sp.]